MSTILIRKTYHFGEASHLQHVQELPACTRYIRDGHSMETLNPSIDVAHTVGNGNNYADLFTSICSYGSSC